MNVIDLLLVLIVLFSVYGGYLKGFITGSLQLLMMVAGLLFAFFLYPYFATFLDKVVPSLGIWRVPVAFIVGLLIARAVLSFILGRILSTIPSSTHAHPVNRVMGIVPGAINGAMWAILAAALLLSVPLPDRLSKIATESRMAGKMADKVSWLDEKLSPFLDELVNKPFGKIQMNAEAEKSVSLPFKHDNPKLREDLESKMLVLVNEEREKVGLKPLRADPEMLDVARAHSKDMFARGYFAHETPEGLSPFDRMKRAKVRFRAAGENLALGQTLNICHRGLMNSPGHRKNILNPAFGRVGIGILDGGIYGLMISQEFRN